MIEIRQARKEDCREIQRMIKELADFEKLPDGPKLTREDLERDGFERDPPLFQALVAVDDGKVIGHALYYYIYSSWEGKSIFLNDFYISPEYRRKGIGSQMFDVLAKKAADDNCSRLEFQVLDWNPASEMYKRKGAEDVTKSDGVHSWRLGGEALKKYRSSP